MIEEFNEDEILLVKEAFQIAMDKIENYFATGDASFLNNYTFDEMMLIKGSMLFFYEKSEEYERCKKIKEFFERVESHMKLSEIMGSTSKLPSLIQGVINAKNSSRG
jgi:hypothetical protein